MTRPFLHTSKTAIVDGAERSIHLKGVNFGGWLMMEAYFMHAPNTAEQRMKKEFARALGSGALADLEKAFRGNFIRAQDMRQVKDWGFNCVRLPFNCRLLGGKPYNKAGLAYLDQAIVWAKAYGIYLILDLHAAPGCQNHDWHSDSLGKAQLWSKKSNRRQTYALWEFLADRYKDEPAIAGYDLVNEPVLDNMRLLNEFYRETIKAIRRSDKNHILFVEGSRWSQVVDVLEDFNDDNWAYSIHFYEPLEFTFNFVPGMLYPLKGWNKDTLRRRLEEYRRFADLKQRPVHVGEFGVNARAGLYGEDAYLKDVVKCFNDYGFHWNYWTYKAVKHFMFPDGLYSYYPNPAWVNRPGPVTGWNRWKDTWPKHKKEMAASWRTEEFTLNEKILKALLIS